MADLPMADAVPKGVTADFPAVAARQGLAGAASTTKWNELITYFRSLPGWRPSYRTKFVTGELSRWGSEWFYHLPFPFVGVQWLDIERRQAIRRGRLVAPEVIDQSATFADELHRIGLDFDRSETVIRVWGYLPKSYENFNDLVDNAGSGQTSANPPANPRT